MIPFRAILAALVLVACAGEAIACTNPFTLGNSGGAPGVIRLCAGTDANGYLLPQVELFDQSANGIASTGNALNVASAPLATSSSSYGITPVVSAAAEASHILKASAGNLYSLYVTTGSTAGYLMTFNATSAPADGAVTPVECVYAPALSTVSVDVGSAPPDVYSTGITAVFSTTGCFTKAASATAFFKARVK